MRLKLIFLTIFNFIVFLSFAQITSVTVSGTVKDSVTKAALPFVNVQLKNATDASFVTGTVSNDAGLFTLTSVKSGNYIIELSYIGYTSKKQDLFVGSSTQFLNISAIEIHENKQLLGEVVVTAKAEDVGSKMDKKTFSVDDNISQKGGSVLQAMQNCQIKTLVFSSSATGYGNPQYLPLNEDHPLSSTNPYGQTKLVIENMLRDLQHSDATCSDLRIKG